MLKGKVAVITGAGRGIGAAAARLLGREGARVVVNDLDGSVADSAAAEIRATGGEAVGFGGSVVDADFPEALLAYTAAEFGPVDVLVNNAGFLFDGVLHKMDDSQWGAVVDCHLGVALPLCFHRSRPPVRQRSVQWLLPAFAPLNLSLSLQRRALPSHRPSSSDALPVHLSL